MDKNRLLSRKEVQEIFGLNVRYLELAALQGSGPTSIKLGHRTVRYRFCDVERWIEQQAARETANV